MKTALTLTVVTVLAALAFACGGAEKPANDATSAASGAVATAEASASAVTSAVNTATSK